jgi:hypothetical protein
MHLKSTKLLERSHQTQRQRSLVVRMLPAPSAAELRAACGSVSRSARLSNAGSCLCLIRALATDQHEKWIDGSRYLAMQALADLHKIQLQIAARRPQKARGPGTGEPPALKLKLIVKTKFPPMVFDSLILLNLTDAFLYRPVLRSVKFGWHWR